MKTLKRSYLLPLALAAALVLNAQTPPAPPSPTPPSPGQPAQPQRQRPPSSRRTQRVVPMQEVRVASPDGRVQFILSPNAERLTYQVMMGDTTVIEPSAIRLNVDGFDLGSGVAFSQIERSEIKENYAWHGAHNRAVNHCNTATISLRHDLSITPYTLEARAFNDGVAYRIVVPGAENETRTPDEFSEFIVLPESRIGELSIFARRSGTMWMLAVMGAGPAKTIQVPLSFLGDGTYQSTLVRDDPQNDAAVKITTGAHTRRDTLTIPLHGGGGFVGRFTR